MKKPPAEKLALWSATILGGKEATRKCPWDDAVDKAYKVWVAVVVYLKTVKKQPKRK